MSKLDVLNEGRSQGFLTEDGFIDRKSVIDEHGTDRYGAEFKRTSNDFRLRYLTQDNCVCGSLRMSLATIGIRGRIGFAKRYKQKRTAFGYARGAWRT